MTFRDIFTSRKSDLRIYLSFWVFGLCNNYSYVVMLSAANDILKKLENSSSSKNGSYSIGDKINLDCNKVGTGAILVADIVPTLIFKLVAPFFIQSIKFPHKVLFVVLAAVASFIIVGLSKSIALTLFGVVLASLSSGVGEVTFLGLTAFYHKNSISYWSSGTGGAGVFGALSYAGLASVLSPENSLFSVAVVPIFILIFYLFVLIKPENNSFNWLYSCKYELLLNAEVTETNSSETKSLIQKSPPFIEKLHLIKSLLYLTVPLALVYLFEYVINQSLFELLYFPNAFLTHPKQYRWYQVIYQIGVFISRSSVNFVKIRKTWIFTILQAFNVILLTLQVVYRFIPSIWVVFVLILYEGLLGGAAYVNTFYLILTESNPDFKEYNMSAASFWDSLGISIAGWISIPIHNLLCYYFSK